MTDSVFLVSPTATLWGAAFTLILAMACVSDARRLRIPNELVLVLLLSGLLYAIARPGPPLGNVAFALAGMTLGFLLWLPFYILRWLGAGDVKLFAAAGAWLGPIATINAAVIAAIVGGLISLVWMLWTYGASGTVMNTSIVLSSARLRADPAPSLRGSTRLPYGIALSVGALATAWFPHAFFWMQHATR